VNTIFLETAALQRNSNSMETLTMDLTGKLLIAMPGMGDARFEHAVLLICAHNPEGAMGVILNKPAPDLDLRDLFAQLGIQHGATLPIMPVQLGGPVELSRGFVLHSNDWRGEGGSLAVTDALTLTSTRDILEAIGQGLGPDDALLALGYAGWGPGQLEAEILQNVWLTADLDDQIIFHAPNTKKWEAALQGLGIDPMTLSATAGHA
jgi:putative transcriptional regulator